MSTTCIYCGSGNCIVSYRKRFNKTLQTLAFDKTQRKICQCCANTLKRLNRARKLNGQPNLTREEAGTIIT